MELLIDRNTKRTFELNFDFNLLKSYSLPLGKNSGGITNLSNKDFIYYPKNGTYHSLGPSTFIWNRAHKNLIRKSYEKDPSGVEFCGEFANNPYIYSHVIRSRQGEKNRAVKYKKCGGMKGLNYPQQVYNSIRKGKLGILKISYTFPLYNPIHLPWYNMSNFTAVVDTIYHNATVTGPLTLVRNALHSFTRVEKIEMIKTAFGKHYPLPKTVTENPDKTVQKHLHFLREVVINETLFFDINQITIGVNTFKKSLHHTNVFTIPQHASLKTILLISYLQDIMRDTKSSELKYAPLKKGIDWTMQGPKLEVKQQKNLA